MELIKINLLKNKDKYFIVDQTYPKNETKEHFICKSLAKLLLYDLHQCRYIATEVELMHNQQCNKHIIDAVGITRHKDKVYGYEAKASLSDYKNGFCTHCPYTYIICPKDVIPIELIPKDIGLVYLDIDEVGFISHGAKREIYGYKVIKKARKRKNTLAFGKYYKNYEDMSIWTNYIFDEICSRNSIESVFKTNIIPKYSKKKSN